MPDFFRVLWAPSDLFHQQCSRPFRLRWAAATFGAFLLCALLASGIVFSRLQSALPADLSPDIKKWNLFGFSLSLGAQLLGGILLWVIGTGILTCLSILMDGEGEYRKLLELTGYAHLPMAIFGIVAVVFAILYQPTLEIAMPAINAPQEELKAALILGLQNELSRDAFRIIGAVKDTVYLWTGVLCVVALHKSNRLPYPKSAIAFLGLILFYTLIEWLRKTFLPAYA